MAVILTFFGGNNDIVIVLVAMILNLAYGSNIDRDFVVVIVTLFMEIILTLR